MPNAKVHIVAVVGTRPEVVKMAPVISALKSSDWARVSVLATAQHREMLDQSLAVFGIRADMDLDLMLPNQSLAKLTSRLVAGLDDAYEALRPDAVLAQGDTTTVLASALCAFYRRIPFGHVEAGLRTHAIDNPFPEEMNRVMTARVAKWHFAPTERSAENLLAEGVPAQRIHVTGNTVIDALLEVANRAAPSPFPRVASRRLILVTAHRRENFGEPLRNVLLAIRTLVERRPDIEVLYPVHPNPNVRSAVAAVLSNHPRVSLIEPLDYTQFIAAMKSASVILSDSGGVQEEAPALGKPVLVLRNETERPEAVEAGVVKLVGSDRETIVLETERLLDDPTYCRSMARGSSPYGDGRAAERIHRVLRENFVSATKQELEELK
jgi:UDP-N-acetylglucosamine 2-epimerase (non-hydrolysing)